MKSATLAVVLVSLFLIGKASAVEFSTVEVAGKRVTVGRIDLSKERLQLFLHDERGQPFKRFDHLIPWLQSHGERLVFAMNAGMYHADFSPVGLFVSRGEQWAALNTSNGEGNFFLKPNGVFVVTEAGARIVESSEYPKIRQRVILATQSGPLLVRGGDIHPGFNANSISRVIRNGVGIPSSGVVLFAISEEPVSLYEFAALFRDKLHCPDALYLDGAISSLYSKELGRNDSRADLGPIIAVTE